MNKPKSFKDRIAQINRLWGASSYDRAFAKVNELRVKHPDNPQVLVMWASLLQLLDESEYSLADAKKALNQAIELDESSPAASIELGHFLDAIEDKPKAASDAFANAISQAKDLLIDALLGNARSLLQLNRRSEAIQCLFDALQVSKFGAFIPNGRKQANSVTSEIESLFNEVLSEPLNRTE